MTLTVTLRQQPINFEAFGMRHLDLGSRMQDEILRFKPERIEGDEIVWRLGNNMMTPDQVVERVLVVLAGTPSDSRHRGSVVSYATRDYIDLLLTHQIRPRMPTDNATCSASSASSSRERFIYPVTMISTTLADPPIHPRRLQAQAPALSIGLLTAGRIRALPQRTTQINSQKVCALQGMLLTEHVSGVIMVPLAD